MFPVIQAMQIIIVKQGGILDRKSICFEKGQVLEEPNPAACTHCAVTWKAEQAYHLFPGTCFQQAWQISNEECITLQGGSESLAGLGYEAPTQSQPEFNCQGGK
jgi:hypothetical protein